MFEGLDEHIKHDDQAEYTPRQRYLKWATIAVVSIVLFSALYIGLRTLQP